MQHSNVIISSFTKLPWPGDSAWPLVVRVKLPLTLSLLVLNVQQASRKYQYSVVSLDRKSHRDLPFLQQTLNPLSLIIYLSPLTLLCAELLHSLVVNGQNCTLMARFTEGVSVLLPTH